VSLKQIIGADLATAIGLGADASNAKPVKSAKSDKPEIPHRNLFALSQDEQAIMDLLIECGGDVTDPQTSATIDAWIAEVQAGQAEAIDRTGMVIRRLESNAVVARAEKERYDAKLRACENAVKALKERIKRHMESIGASKLQTQHFELRIQANGGVQQIETPADPASLPPEFVQMVPRANTEAIRKALDDGLDVPGCKLVPRGTHLRIA
jgi:hypothetical protein